MASALGEQLADALGTRQGCILEFMLIRVLYFGILKDVFHVGSESVELPDGATAGAALRFLRERTSNENAPWSSLAMAVNREYATVATALHEGDELALLPPVSGGCLGEMQR